MDNSGGTLEDQRGDRNVDNKGQAEGVSVVNKDSTGMHITQHLMFVSAFHSCLGLRGKSLLGVAEQI